MFIFFILLYFWQKGWIAAGTANCKQCFHPKYTLSRRNMRTTRVGDATIPAERVKQRVAVSSDRVLEAELTEGRSRLIVFSQFWFGSPWNMLLVYRWLENNWRCVFVILVVVSLVVNAWAVSLAWWFFLKLYLVQPAQAYPGCEYGVLLFQILLLLKSPGPRQQYNHNFPALPRSGLVWVYGGVTFGFSLLF